MNRPYRLVIGADFQCGHFAGLTPPVWQTKCTKAWVNCAATPKLRRLKRLREKIANMQEQCWNAYSDMIAAARPIDAAAWDGDLIDGRGERSGGTELITSDRDEQVGMASYAIHHARAPRNFIVRGTGYHTGDKEDFENLIADDVQAEKITDHLWLNANGLIFDVKHKIAGSIIPHGRPTAIGRERLWNMLWAERGKSAQPRAQVFVRAHVHYHIFTGDAYWLGVIAPALQAAHTKYGARQCSGTVDFGILVFDITSRKEWTWRADTLELPVVGQRAVRLSR